MPMISAIDRCVAGDPAAFELVVRTYADSLVGLLRSVVGNREDARELAQETFVRALRYLSRFDRRRPFKPWLFRIGRNLAYDFLAAQQRAPKAASAEESARVLTAAADPRPSPAESLAERQRSAELHAVLATLRPVYREVLIYRYLERLDVEEIASVLGVPPSTVKVWLFRARAQFRERSKGRELS